MIRGVREQRDAAVVGGWSQVIRRSAVNRGDRRLACALSDFLHSAAAHVLGFTRDLVTVACECGSVDRRAVHFHSPPAAWPGRHFASPSDM